MTLELHATTGKEQSNAKRTCLRRLDAAVWSARCPGEKTIPAILAMGPVGPCSWGSIAVKAASARRAEPESKLACATFCEEHR